eukprot:6772569-Prymnesium_polylepis.1
MACAMRPTRLLRSSISNAERFHSPCHPVPSPRRTGAREVCAPARGRAGIPRLALTGRGGATRQLVRGGIR